MKFPFEVPFTELKANPDEYIYAVFSCLESEFLVLPRGEGFIDYPVFEQGYESLKQATNGFQNIVAGPVLNTALQFPLIIIILRTMLGFTPPEWAYVTTQRTGVEVTQGFVRSLDRNIRISPITPLINNPITNGRIKALVETACQLHRILSSPANLIPRLLLKLKSLRMMVRPGTRLLVFSILQR